MNDSKIQSKNLFKLNFSEQKFRATFNVTSSNKNKFFQLNKCFSKAVGKVFKKEMSQEIEDNQYVLKRMSLKRDNLQQFLSRDFIFFDKQNFKQNRLYKTRVKNDKDFKNTFIQIQKQKIQNQLKKINAFLKRENNFLKIIEFKFIIVTGSGQKFCQFKKKFSSFYKKFYKININQKFMLKNFQYLKNFIQVIQNSLLQFDIRDDIDLQVFLQKVMLKDFQDQSSQKHIYIVQQEKEKILCKKLLQQFFKKKIIRQKYDTLDAIEQNVIIYSSAEDEEQNNLTILQLPEYLRTDQIRNKIEEKNHTLKEFKLHSKHFLKGDNKKCFNLNSGKGNFKEFKNQLHFPVIRNLSLQKENGKITDQYNFKNLDKQNIDQRLQFCSKLLNSKNFQNYTFKKFVCVLDAVEMQKFNFESKSQKENMKLKKNFKRIEDIIDQDYLKYVPQETIKEKIEFLQKYIDKNSIQVYLSQKKLFKLIIMQTSFLSRLSENFNGKSFYNNKSNTNSNKISKTFDFWRGNNVFYLDGKIMSGPEDEKFFQFSFLVFLFIMTVVYYTAIVPHIQLDLQNFYVYFYLFTFGLFLTFYLLTSFTEPGYIPHQNILRVPQLINAHSNQDKKIIMTASQNNNYPFESNLQEISNENDQQIQNIAQQDVEGQASQNLSGETLPFESSNFCVYCKIYKPQRTHHCRTCNACVRVFDHHCTLANNCIGKRNYQFFILMNFFGFISNIIFVVGCIQLYHVQVLSGNFAFALFLWILLSHSILILGFCCFQLTLFLFFQQTTKEFVLDLTYELKKEYADWFFMSDCLIKYKQEITEENKIVLMQQLKFLMNHKTKLCKYF